MANFERLPALSSILDDLTMGIRFKLNLAIIAITLFSIGLFWLTATPFLEAIARDEVLQRSRIMMESAAGTRKYTSEEIAPILVPMMHQKFLRQAVSSYAAVSNFQLLQEKNPDYSYREPALNPTNPKSRATDWEADIIQDFRAHPTKTELITERITHAGPILSLSHPIRVSAGCLMCHDRPEAAPASMTSEYGTQNGFGWQAGEIVAAQLVSVPLAVPLANAAKIRNIVVAMLAGISIVTILLVDLLLGILVINPVKRMSVLAVEVSMGKTDAAEFVRSGSDEIATLSASINRLRRSTEEALKLLSPE
jgi:protein-histidine pros-kinase